MMSSATVRCDTSRRAALSIIGVALGPPVLVPRCSAAIWSSASWKLHSMISAIRRLSVSTASRALITPSLLCIHPLNVALHALTQLQSVGGDGMSATFHTSLIPAAFGRLTCSPASPSLKGLWSDSIWFSSISIETTDCSSCGETNT